MNIPTMIMAHAKKTWGNNENEIGRNTVPMIRG